MSDQIMLVDDEPRILDAFRRTLRSRYSIVTAGSGQEALGLLQAETPDSRFAVVVSDMQMPGMNGAEFLTRAAQITPDAVQMILSGHADLVSTIEAVNNGNLFRFLTKPCSPENLIKSLDDALRQYRLVISERELLEQTLQGAVDILGEMLSLTNPQAFSKSGTLASLVAGTAERLGVEVDWQLRLAATLSQIGCIAIPPPVLERAEKGGSLSADDEAMLRGHPLLARELLRRIPRLDVVADWIGGQAVPGTPISAPPPDGPGRLLAAATAFLVLCDRGEGQREAARHLAGVGYPQPLLDALLESASDLRPSGVVRELTGDQIREGMLLDQDVLTTTGMVLVRRGERVTPTLAARLTNFARSVGVVEPIKVIVGP